MFVPRRCATKARFRTLHRSAPSRLLSSSVLLLCYARHHRSPPYRLQGLDRTPPHLVRSTLASLAGTGRALRCRCVRWTVSRLYRPTSTRSSRACPASRSSSSTPIRCAALLSSSRKSAQTDKRKPPLQTPILSLATTQSHLLSHEVYLTDRIDNPARHSLPVASAASASAAYPPTASTSRGIERLPHLKCVCLLRPTDESVEACARELREGRFGSYWLCAYSSTTMCTKQCEG